MIRDVDTLKAEILDWMQRADLVDKTDMFIAPVIADSATLLNIFVTETFMTQKAVEGQDFMILPTLFCGALEFRVEDKRYQRVSFREVMDGEINCSYTVHGERILFYPAAKLNDVLRLEFRGLSRGGKVGFDMDLEQLAQFFHRSESVTGSTGTIGDSQGRYPLVLEEITQPNRDADAVPGPAYVDRITDSYNAAQRLLERFPNLFLYGALVNAYRYIQDETRAQYWQSLYAEQISLAQRQLLAAKHGGDKLHIRPRGRSLLQGRR
jgi:hypothetical protein